MTTVNYYHYSVLDVTDASGVGVGFGTAPDGSKRLCVGLRPTAIIGRGLSPATKMDNWIALSPESAFELYDQLRMIYEHAHGQGQYGSGEAGCRSPSRERYTEALIKQRAHWIVEFPPRPEAKSTLFAKGSRVRVIESHRTRGVVRGVDVEGALAVYTVDLDREDEACPFVEGEIELDAPGCSCFWCGRKEPKVTP